MYNEDERTQVHVFPYDPARATESLKAEPDNPLSCEISSAPNAIEIQDLSQVTHLPSLPGCGDHGRNLPPKTLHRPTRSSNKELLP
jgi:hypothetical protein